VALVETKGLAFPISFSPLGHLNRASGATKLKGNMSQIILTAVGERLMRPRFGTRGTKAVFRKTDEVTAALLQSTVVESLTMYEPRVQVVQVDVWPEDRPAGRFLLIRVGYRLRSSGEFSTVDLEVPLV